MKRWLRAQALFAPALLVVMAIGPTFAGRGTIGIFLTFMVVLYLAYSWNIVGGIIGELSIAHIVMWGIGSYGIILASQHGISLFVATVGVFILGAVGSALLVVVANVLRLEGLYLAVFTLVIAEIAIAATQVSAALGQNAGLRLASTERFTVSVYHAVAVALLVLVMLVNWAVLRAPVGQRWLALRDDAVAAQAMGIAVWREKIFAYALSGGLAALGGAFQAHYLGFAQPATALSISFLVIAVLCVYAGGPGTFLGPAIGALMIQGLASVANALSTDVAVARMARLAQYLVAFVLVRAVVSKAGGDDLVSALTRRRPRATEGVAGVDSRPRPEVVDDRPMVPTDGSPLLEIQGLAKSFAGLDVLKHVNFSVREGEFVALVGPNGAGKTTVCNIVTGFLTATRGHVLFRSTDLERLPPDRRFDAGIVRTFQTPRLFPRLTLRENVAVACNGDTEKAVDVLRRVGIEGAGRKALDATLFEHRMVEVARAIASGASMLTLDEPLAGLSPMQRETILGAVSEEVRGGTSVLIIEHLIPVISPVVDRMVVLASGVVLADGPPTIVLNDEAVIESYLGQPVG